MIDWTGVDTHSWMSKLPNNRYLNDINIPGVANAALAYTEAQAIDGDTTDIQKARSIAQYCRQSNTIYYNMNSGYRALDYGLNFKNLALVKQCKLMDTHLHLLTEMLLLLEM